MKQRENVRYITMLQLSEKNNRDQNYNEIDSRGSKKIGGSNSLYLNGPIKFYILEPICKKASFSREKERLRDRDTTKRQKPVCQLGQKNFIYLYFEYFLILLPSLCPILSILNNFVEYFLVLFQSSTPLFSFSTPTLFSPEEVPETALDYFFE